MKKNKFHFDERILKDYYLADYFVKTRTILEKQNPEAIVTMQFFQRTPNATLAGIEVVLDLLDFACKNFDDLEIWALPDGSTIDALEPVLRITGHYQDFGFLEGMIDGILSRMTSVATNSAKILQAARGKKVLNMNDRADIYLNQGFDGLASYLGGMLHFVSPAALEFIDDLRVEKPSGTMPHALIQAFNGDLIAALNAFEKTYPQSPLVALVDYNNDCITDALNCAKAFKNRLKFVRIDTAKNLTDKSLQDLNLQKNNGDLTGVNITLVKKLRFELDRAGFSDVKIIVSSGFDANKITEFENERAPVDVYGVGEAITKPTCSFTGDSVLLNHQKQAKFGREYFESQRLKRIN
ncbi:nicotinate phosphoribosyltransferase [Spiroplasma sabaudiense Ar-1343]|uniref:nicotinate phosphoribosyltransferase n=1 Tax=Spiroplasma sabaudiense Ar-1343 TaxID=1276257 RepID=W6AK45_9MOLU|nr:nicotinate phosphoribosyltransferase [Spiroplasma sabaudiense]AHI54099.1 nicotinate phosphoribosyltransferase [Spiroplasma sabaudiense Ar-1343]